MHGLTSFARDRTASPGCPFEISFRQSMTGPVTGRRVRCPPSCREPDPLGGLSKRPPRGGKLRRKPFGASGQQRSGVPVLGRRDAGEGEEVAAAERPYVVVE